VIRLQVDRLPSGAVPKPVWLWCSAVDLTSADVDRLWQAFLRRFDIEHTFRMWKQTLGWTTPKLRDPHAADRLTPTRVRRAFRHLRATTGCPAAAPKPTRPGPGRPPGRPNTHKAPRHPVHLATSGEAEKPKPKTKKPAKPRPRRTG
jgi:hypothetical protein